MNAQSEPRPLALVTGASGFIGSELVRKLAVRGYRVRVLLRSTSSEKNLEGATYEICRGSLDHRASLREAVRGVDVVFHLAGLVTAARPESLFKANCEGTQLLAEACWEEARERQNLARFVYVSSLAAGGPSWIGKPRTEWDPDRPVSAYGRSKLAAEKILEKHAEWFPVTIVRPPAVYGPRDRGIFEFIRLASYGVLPTFPAQVKGSAKTYSLIHVRDLVEGIVRAGANDTAVSPSQRRRFERFYLAGDGLYEWESVIRLAGKALGKPSLLRLPLPRWFWLTRAGVYTLITRVTGREFPLTLDKIPELTADQWTCSSEKAKEVLGFAPSVVVEDGILETVQWYFTAGWLPLQKAPR